MRREGEKLRQRREVESEKMEKGERARSKVEKLRQREKKQ